MKYNSLEFHELSDQALLQLRKGAFLTTKDGDKVNTMTIAWGGINIVWNKPLFVVYVRYSRDTYEMMEKGSEFTVSIPLTKRLKEELAFCGTRSGRDTDKIKECQFTLIEGKEVSVPVIKECDLHYECSVVYKQAMEPGMVPDEIKKRYYSNHDYHVIYYGEIKASYTIEGE